MPLTEINELVESIDRIAAFTRDGKIEWSKLNPSTVVWNFTTPLPGRIIIQQIMNNERQILPTGGQIMRGVVRYLFQVYDVRNAMKISVNSADDPQLEVKLKALYNAASTGISRGGLDFLKSILPP